MFRFDTLWKHLKTKGFSGVLRVYNIMGTLARNRLNFWLLYVVDLNKMNLFSLSLLQRNNGIGKRITTKKKET